MAAKNRSRKMAAIVVALCAAACMALAVWSPWKVADEADRAAQENEMGTSAADGSGEEQSDLPEGITEVNVKDPSEYVGADGSGVVDRDDYDSDEEYLDAVARSMARELEVPRENAEEGGTEYLKGTLTVYFERSIGEARAREIVADHGGLWVDGAFAAATGLDFADATVYAPDLADAGLSGLEELCARLEECEGVIAADPYTTNDFKMSGDALSSQQYYLQSSGFSDAWGA